MNNNLYVNVSNLIDLIECIEKRNNNSKVTETCQEIVSVMYDLRWKEIIPDGVESTNNKIFNRFEVCQRIKQLFDDSGLKRKELAKKLGIKKSMLYAYINEEHLPSAENIAAICKEFDVTADYLIFGE